MSEKWWNSIAYLDILRSPWARKEIVIRERLETGGLSHRQAARLFGVRVDIVVAVFGYMRSDRSRRPRPRLYAEAVKEHISLDDRVSDVLVIWQQVSRKVRELWRAFFNSCKTCGIEVSE